MSIEKLLRGKERELEESLTVWMRENKVLKAEERLAVKCDVVRIKAVEVAIRIPTVSENLSARRYDYVSHELSGKDWETVLSCNWTEHQRKVLLSIKTNNNSPTSPGAGLECRFTAVSVNQKLQKFGVHHIRIKQVGRNEDDRNWTYQLFNVKKC